MPNPFDQSTSGQPGGIPDGGQMNYGDAMKAQNISQFQKMMNDQTPMTYSQMQMVTSNPKYSYGVEGSAQSDAWKSYQRKSQGSRMSFAGAMTGGVVEFGIGSAGAVAGTAAVSGIAATGFAATAIGAAGGFAGMMAAPIVPMLFINEGVQRTLARQGAMRGISSDLDQYKERIGLRNMTYNQATESGGRIGSEMFRNQYTGTKQFFNSDQQQEMFKTGLANDMLSSKSKGMMKGDIKQFEKNVKELFETTEVVVKAMHTTLQGGMSVIKEMQNQGFGTMGQIKQSIIAAKGMGNMTGLGAQNMLQIGAAGAAATNGTQWTAQAGAAMAQAGASQAMWMSRGNNAAAQQSVAKMGGVASAGLALSQMQMGVANSGMGRWMSAYIMNSKGELDPAQLEKLKRGGVSGYEMTMEGSRRYNTMGISGMALFERNKQGVLNDLAKDPIAMSRSVMALYDAWGGTRGGNNKAQAQVFSNMMFGAGSNQANLYADFITSDKGYAEMGAEMSATRMVEGAGFKTKGKFKQFMDTSMELATEPFTVGASKAMIDVYSTIGSMQGGLGDMRLRARNKIYSGIESVADFGNSLLTESAGNQVSGGKKRLFNRDANIGSIDVAARRIYGTDAFSYDAKDVSAYNALSTNQKLAIADPRKRAQTAMTSETAEKIARSLSEDQFKEISTLVATAVGSGTASKLFQDPKILNGMRYTPESANEMKYNAAGAGAALAEDFSKIVTARQSVSSKAEKEVTYSSRYLDNKLKSFGETKSQIEDAVTNLDNPGRDILRAAMARRGAFLEDKKKTMGDSAYKAADEFLEKTLGGGLGGILGNTGKKNAMLAHELNIREKQEEQRKTADPYFKQAEAVSNYAALDTEKITKAVGLAASQSLGMKDESWDAANRSVLDRHNKNFPSSKSVTANKFNAWVEKRSLVGGNATHRSRLANLMGMSADAKDVDIAWNVRNRLEAKIPFTEDALEEFGRDTKGSREEKRKAGAAIVSKIRTDVNAPDGAYQKSATAAVSQAVIGKYTSYMSNAPAGTNTPANQTALLGLLSGGDPRLSGNVGALSILSNGGINTGDYIKEYATNKGAATTRLTQIQSVKSTQDLIEAIAVATKEDKSGANLKNFQNSMQDQEVKEGQYAGQKFRNLGPEALKEVKREMTSKNRNEYEKQSSQSRGINAGIQPPVMNYWNNSWAY